VRPPLDYAPLLRRWSRELLASDLAGQLGVTGEVPDWLGTAPATAHAIDALEARLGLPLPPSYKQFLLTSDGWGPLSPFVHRLRPCAAVDWFVTENASAIEAWSESDDDGLSDAEYFTYADGNPYFRGAHLRHALQIADHGDGDLLLNPRAVTPDGEWECWFLAAWIPGVRRYASFAHWLVSEYRSFRRLANVSGAEPPLPAVAVPPPSVRRKAVRPARAKVPPRTPEELIAAMASADAAVRAKAVRELVGGFKGRGRATRRPDLVGPLTALVRASPDADVRSVCVQAVTELAPDGPTPAAILEAFDDADPWVVLSAIHARHYFPITAAFDRLCRFVDEVPDAMLKDSAVSALADLADPRAIPVLLRVLHDRGQTFDQLFGTAGLALAACGPAAVPHLVSALKDDDPRVRRAAVCGLDQVDDPAVAALLRAMCRDPDKAVRDRAKMAAATRGKG
jgi:hypothetical protein